MDWRWDAFEYISRSRFVFCYVFHQAVNHLGYLERIGAVVITKPSARYQCLDQQLIDFDIDQSQ
jgi:hypothetical protein